MANHYRGKAGTIYLERSEQAGSQWDVWFEDFHIIGAGTSRIEALKDAIRFLGEVDELVKTAIATEEAAGD